MGTRTVEILVEIVRSEQGQRPDPTRAVRSRRFSFSVFGKAREQAGFCLDFWK
jgi:hypothetical protein